MLVFSLSSVFRKNDKEIRYNFLHELDYKINVNLFCFLAITKQKAESR